MGKLVLPSADLKSTGNFIPFSCVTHQNQTRGSDSVVLALIKQVNAPMAQKSQVAMVTNAGIWRLHRYSIKPVR